MLWKRIKKRLGMKRERKKEKKKKTMEKTEVLKRSDAIQKDLGQAVERIVN